MFNISEFLHVPASLQFPFFFSFAHKQKPVKCKRASEYLRDDLGRREGIRATDVGRTVCSQYEASAAAAAAPFISFDTVRWPGGWRVLDEDIVGVRKFLDDFWDFEMFGK
jgi:hypothetical protein